MIALTVTNTDFAQEVYRLQMTTTLTDGLYSTEVVSREKICASVQHPTPDDLQVLPEGQRVESARVFFVDATLSTVNDREGKPADKIELDGRSYTIYSVEDWGSYTKAMGVLDESDNGN